jgi:hypothetical protein
LGRNDAFVLDDKGRALLGKLRKGADASLTLAQLFKVLRFLGGWQIEEIVSFVPMQYVYDGKEIKRVLLVEDQAQARALYGKLQSLQVRSVPSSAKLGQLVVMNLEPFRHFPQSYREPWGAHYDLWVGLPGYRITDPNGKVFELLPNHHDLDGGKSMGERDRTLPTVDAKALLKRLRVYDLTAWLKKQTPYLDQINAALGTEHHAPGAVRTRANTGSCGACFKNVKLEHPGGGKLPVTVLHGYQRPGTGHIEGRCPGENMPPYELSPEATDKERRVLKGQADNLTVHLHRLKSGHVTEFTPYFGAPQVRKSELPEVIWEREIRNEIKRTENQRDGVLDVMKAYEWLVQNWEKHELPKEGEREINWLGIAERKVRAAEWRAKGA